MAPSPALLSGAYVCSILPTRDGRVIYTDGAANMGTVGNAPIHVWDARTLEHKRAFGSAEWPYNRTLRLSPDGRTLFHAMPDGTGVVTDARTGKQKARIQGLSKEHWSYAINDDVLAVEQPRGVELRSLRDGRLAGHLPNPQPGYPKSITFSRDGSLLMWINDPTQLPAMGNHSVVVYAMSPWRKLLVRPLENLAARAIAVSSDNSRLVVLAHYRIPPSGAKDTFFNPHEVLLVLNLKTGREVYRRDVPGRSSGSLCVSPDGRWAAFVNEHPPVSSTNTQVQIVALSNGRVVARHELDRPLPCAAAFSADSRQLLVADDMRCLKLMLDGKWKLMS